MDAHRHKMDTATKMVVLLWTFVIFLILLLVFLLTLDINGARGRLVQMQDEIAYSIAPKEAPYERTYLGSGKEGEDYIEHSTISSVDETLTYYGGLNNAQKQLYDIAHTLAANGLQSDVAYYDGTDYEPSEELKALASDLAGAWDICRQMSYDTPLFTLYQNHDDISYMRLTDEGHLVAHTSSVREDENILGCYDEVERHAEQIYTAAKSDPNVSDARSYITYVYHHLSDNVSYSDDIDDTIHANDIYGALVEGESKCVGMSAAMKYLLDMEGIPNFIGCGKIKESDIGHAWNIIYLNGEWLCCDVTIGSRIIREQYPEATDEEKHQGLTEMVILQACLKPQEEFFGEYGISLFPTGEQLEKAYEEHVEEFEPVIMRKIVKLDKIENSEEPKRFEYDENARPMRQ